MNLSFILSAMPSKRQPPEGRATSLSRLRGTLSNPLVIQFVKFGTVGVSNTLLTFLVYTLLLKVFGVWYLAASAIGFLVGAINGFLWNRRWTFKEHVGDLLTPVRWGIVQGCGLGLNLLLLFLLVHSAGVDKLLSQALATGVVTVLTFLANRAWTFRVHAPIAVADNDG
jgi:putative flippase GtrA